MGSIRGHFEWDDDSLAPGHRKDGGLHQNLFDDEGNLRGHARFVPDDEQGEDSEPIVVTEQVYITTERRDRDADREARDELIRDVVVLLFVGIEKAGPHVQRWWQEKGRPSMEARLEGRRLRRDDRRRRRQELKAVKHEVLEPTVVEASIEVAERESAGQAPPMSAAEAQARLIAAAAARAFSEHQMNLVHEARIVGDLGIDEIQQRLAELPPDRLQQLVATLMSDPRLLTEDNLASLASFVGRGEL
jgi:hypothetical protein